MNLCRTITLHRVSTARPRKSRTDRESTNSPRKKENRKCKSKRSRLKTTRHIVAVESRVRIKEKGTTIVEKMIMNSFDVSYLFSFK